MSTASHAEALANLRKHISECCRRDLSKAFVAWLLQKPEHGFDLGSIADQAAKREGAGQDFQTVAILGFAAKAGVLSEQQAEQLKKGLSRLAGRNPVVNGVPMAFSADAVGILGVGLGTKAVADAEVTGQIVRWAAKFLRTSYERDQAEDWQRCLFAIVDRQLRSSLDLSIPRSAAAADVRTALIARGLIDSFNEDQARQDHAQTLEMALRESQKSLNCERAALRLAAVEWAIRIAATTAEEGRQGFIKQGKREASGTDPEGPQERRKVKKPVRRNPRYEVIDRALAAIAEGRPRTQEEIFQCLEVRRVVTPAAEPFMGARGWISGFARDSAAARAWLSKRWRELNLPAMTRGPKTPTK